VEARNANYAAVVRNLQFTKRAWFGLRIADEPEDSRRQHVFSDSDSDSSSGADEELEGVEQVRDTCERSRQEALAAI